MQYYPFTFIIIYRVLKLDKLRFYISYELLNILQKFPIVLQQVIAHYISILASYYLELKYYSILSFTP